ncbi:MAG TPA: GDP-mannose 4,6-dehydratase, partial [Planctomycetaceae bacterium]
GVGLDWREHVEFDPRYCRPTEVDLLLGDYSKAKAELGWEPQVRLPELVRIMVAHDRELARREAHADTYEGPVATGLGGTGTSER